MVHPRVDNLQRNLNNPNVKHSSTSLEFHRAWFLKKLHRGHNGGAGRPPGVETGAAQRVKRRVTPSKLAGYEGNSQVRSWKEVCEVGYLDEAVEALELLVQRGSYVNNSVFYSVLKKCIKQKDLFRGRRVHALALKSGYESNSFLANHIICMYASHGRLEEAVQAFSKVPAPSRQMWASIILAYSRHGQPTRAINLYAQLRQSAVKPDNHIFVAVLKACATATDLSAGRQVHDDILQNANKPNIFVGNCLIDMYSKCGSLEDARRVFENVSSRDVVTWNAMIAGYVQHGLGQEALALFGSMEQEGITSADAITFACVLQACSSVGALHRGKLLHAQIQVSGLEADAVIGTCLVGMYAKCGSLEDARKVFNCLKRRDVVTWNAMIAGYVQHGLGQDALALYATMVDKLRTIHPDRVTYVSVLQACAIVGDSQLGEDIHTQVKFKGLGADIVVATCLVDMYAKCGNLQEAQILFDNMPIKNVVTWTALIGGYAHQGLGHEALALYGSMEAEGIALPNDVTFVCLLQACASTGALHQGQQVHAQILQRGLEADLVIGNSLVNMYAKCGSLSDARRVFDSMPTKDVVTWNGMITGYTGHGVNGEALALYDSMQLDGIIPADAVTFACLLRACHGVAGLKKGKEIHAQISKVGLQATDLLLANALIDMYSNCGSLEDACRLFAGLPAKDAATWTAMIAGHAQCGLIEEAFAFYASMQQEGITPANAGTFVCILQACARTGALHKGKQIHGDIWEMRLEADMVVGTCLVDMYAKCGSLEDARAVFDNLASRDVVMWNAMIAGYVQHDRGEEALSLYASMEQEGVTAADHVTFVCLLQACDSSEALPLGRQLHEQIKNRGWETDVVVGTCLVVMYSKCGSLQDARKVFDHLPVRNVVTWTAMINAHAQDGLAHEALVLYRNMAQEGEVLGTTVTFVCLLLACGSMASLEMGQEIHAQISKVGLDHSDVLVANALIDMYGKCGSMADAQQSFEALPTTRRDTVTWSALIAGYSRQGESEVVFSLFDMATLEGMQPDGTIFLSLLTVCNHVGLVDKGRQCFEAMSKDYGLTPTVEHYACMVDLLGRAGYVKEAMEMVRTMPFEPNIVVWKCVLGACRKWGQVELGRDAFQGALRANRNDAAAYVLMSNIYAGAQMYEDARAIRAMRLKTGAWKKAGQSWWTDGCSGVVHVFRAGDRGHPEWQWIDRKLKYLFVKMKKAGYVPHLKSVLRDIADEEKEAALCGHSEKLAIAYALHKTLEGTTIRVAKNLRVCEDCHRATAFISKIEQRTIMCRDGSRFHVFKDGKCSCGDYW